MSKTPSELGREIILQYVSKGAEALLLASCGTHMHNPYHNLDHELSVVYYAHAAYMNEPDSEFTSRNTSLDHRVLLLAALFHDHNHSGGKTHDWDNIQRTLQFVDGSEFHRILSLESSEVTKIKDIIRCTQFFEGQFTYTPDNLCQQAIRDADLMMIYSMEGHDLLDGLFVEMGKPLSGYDDKAVSEALARNASFLRDSKMYTQYGQWMKEFHLESALRSFRAGHIRGGQ